MINRAKNIWQRERLLMVVLMVMAAASWVFIELADEVLEGSTRQIDTAILLGLRMPGNPDLPIGPQWLHELMRDYTALGGTGILVLISIITVAYLTGIGRKREAVAVLVAIAGGLLLSTFAKLGFDRPRPDLVPHGSITMTASFPSGHSLMASVVYLTIATLLARVQPRRALKGLVIACAIFIVILVGVSRVYLGVHWPTDVLAGWTIGSAWALATGYLLWRFGLTRHARE